MVAKSCASALQYHRVIDAARKQNECSCLANGIVLQLYEEMSRSPRIRVNLVFPSFSFNPDFLGFVARPDHDRLR